jgi:hypothetical protein
MPHPQASKCCNAPVRVAGGGSGEIGSRWYVCEQCNNPTDTIKLPFLPKVKQVKKCGGWYSETNTK